MSALVAIDLSSEDATVIEVESSNTGTLSIREVTSLPREELLAPSSEPLDADNSTEPQDSKDETALRFTAADVDASYALLDAENILYEHIELPFSDEKKLEKVSPLQVQELVPFDVSNFLIDNLILEVQPSGESSILTSLTPEREVRSTLLSLSHLGLDPEVLTTRSSALTGLPSLFPETLNGFFAIVSLEAGRGAFAIFANNKLCELRDLIVADNSEGTSEFITQFRCSHRRAEAEQQIVLSKVVLLTKNKTLQKKLEKLSLSVEILDISEKVDISQTTLSEETLAVTLGMLSPELQKKASSESSNIVNFRTGPLAFRPALRMLGNALKSELSFILFALIALIAYCGFTVYANQTQLSNIENAIQERISAYISEPVPKKDEIAFLDAKIRELEEQLSDMGSLSSLSPLDSLKEISEAINKTIDIHVDLIKIRSDSVSFRGTVGDNPTSGRLESVLKARNTKFCTVKVNPAGNVRGSSRVSYVADIKLCPKYVK